MSCQENVFKTPHGKDKKTVCSPTLPVGAGPGDMLSIPASPAMKKLGFGTGVNVFLLERCSPGRGSYGSPWAIKKINSKLKSRSSVNGGSCSSSDGSASPALRRQPPLSQVWHSRLEEEAKVLRSLRHPNIIGFRGYSTSVDGTKCLVMESGERDLYNILEQRSENSDGPLPALHALAVSRGVASALQYMHEEHHLLHGDIKSANVLIKGDFDQVKLCDFGVSLKLDDKLEACADQFYVGTECWSPPEVINEDAPVTDKSDIFAFGLTIWECLSLEPPHVHALMSTEGEERLSTDEQDKLSEDRDELFRTYLGTRPPLPPAAAHLTGAYLPLLEAFYHCTSEKADQRPSAAALATLFDDVWGEWGGKGGKSSEQGKVSGEFEVETKGEQSKATEGTSTVIVEAEAVNCEDKETERTDTDVSSVVHAATEDCNSTEISNDGSDILSADSERNSLTNCDQNTVPVEKETKEGDEPSKSNKRKSSSHLDGGDKENCVEVDESSDSVPRKKIKADYEA